MLVTVGCLTLPSASPKAYCPHFFPLRLWFVQCSDTGIAQHMLLLGHE